MSEIIEISEEKHNQFDSVSPHIVQSYIWGNFRAHIGSKVIYLMEMDGGTPIASWLLYITYIPKTKKTLKVGIISECAKPHAALIAKLKEIAKREHLLFIKLEPLVEDTPDHKAYLESLGLVKGKDNFLKNTFILDISRTSEDIFSHFSSSTRRNIRIAEKNMVEVTAYPYKRFDYSALEEFLKIQEETTKRQHFSSHPTSYYFTLYDVLKDKIHILLAKIDGKVVAGVVLFFFKERAYYPYGASLHEHIDSKATNLLLSQSIIYAKKNGMTSFDFWGALTHDAQETDTLYGVHSFKRGYGGELYEYGGAYDLIIHAIGYHLFNLAHNLYRKVIKLKN